MKARQGYVQGYNAQAVVSEEQIIVAVGVTQEANDVQQLEPMLQTMAHTLEAAGIEDRPKAGLADAGYWSEANIRACSWPEMPELLIATTKDWKQRKMLREKGCPRGRIPKGLSPRDRMERKLLTKGGRALLTGVFVAFLAADVGFVYLRRTLYRYGFHIAAGCPQTVEHEPGGLLGDAKFLR